MTFYGLGHVQRGVFPSAIAQGQVCKFGWSLDRNRASIFGLKSKTYAPKICLTIRGFPVKLQFVAFSTFLAVYFGSAIHCVCQEMPRAPIMVRDLPVPQRTARLSEFIQQKTETLSTRRFQPASFTLNRTITGKDGSVKIKPADPSDNETPRRSDSSSLLTLDALDSSEPDTGTSSGVKSKTSSLSTDAQSNTWRDNLRATLDLSVRPTFFGQTGEFGNSTFIGIDLLKVFTSDTGDFGTLTLQPYLTRIDNIYDAPLSSFDDQHDWELIYRIFNFNFTGKGKGKTNYRIGHYELPFGLEQIINTNGTLRDYTHFENFGLKSDWGVTFNGENSDAEYEIGLSRGSGNEFRSRDDPYILAGRIGTSRDELFVLGASALHGETLNFTPTGGTTRRTRVGIDMTFADESLVYLAELSAGFQDDSRVFTGLFEADWFNKDDSVLLYNQFVVGGLGVSSDWDYEVRDSFGIRWLPDTHWTLSTQLTHFFDSLGSRGRGTTVELQARYRF